MKLERIACLVLLIALVAVPVWPHGGHEHGKKQELRHHDLRGTIQSLDSANKTFTLQMKDKTVICYFDEKTRMTRDGKDVATSELKPGAAVTCRCSEEKEGRHYSQRIWLRSR